jgi:hypothetical protein
MQTADNQRRIPIEEIALLRRQGRGEQEAERCVLSAHVSGVCQAHDDNPSGWCALASGISNMLSVGGGSDSKYLTR